MLMRPTSTNGDVGAFFFVSTKLPLVVHTDVISIRQILNLIEREWKTMKELFLLFFSETISHACD
jgi:hypothetical protein